MSVSCVDEKKNSVRSRKYLLRPLYRSACLFLLKDSGKHDKNDKGGIFSAPGEQMKGAI